MQYVHAHTGYHMSSVSPRTVYQIRGLLCDYEASCVFHTSALTEGEEAGLQEEFLFGNTTKQHSGSHEARNHCWHHAHTADCGLEHDSERRCPSSFTEMDCDGDCVVDFHEFGWAALNGMGSTRFNNSAEALRKAYLRLDSNDGDLGLTVGDFRQCFQSGSTAGSNCLQTLIPATVGWVEGAHTREVYPFLLAWPGLAAQETELELQQQRRRSQEEDAASLQQDVDSAAIDQVVDKLLDVELDARLHEASGWIETAQCGDST